jgi:pimeloyl-ACP methyl ester carboxylesterase
MLAKTTLTLTVLLFLGAFHPAAAQKAYWTAEEMGAGGEAQAAFLTLPLVPDDQADPAGSPCEDKSSCEFRLAYFLGAGFDLGKKQRLNILFIPGGPGALVDTSGRPVALRLLERRHNVVYFHPRGMGRSAIDGDRQYDRFLRAGYVVEDIERLRRALLKDRPWDAIYAHSWGTVVAQRYAAKYGGTKGAPSRVLSLVLSGPVDRHRPDTYGARRKMIIDNFKMILSYYRSKGAAGCQCESASYLRTRVTDYSDPQISPFGSRLGASDNFCFLTVAPEEIAGKFERILVEIEENYISADFVVDLFAGLKGNPEFQARFEKLPAEFFAAVRYLQMTGAPVKDGLVFTADSRQRINAALVIGHYLSAVDRSRCREDAGFFKGAAPYCEYCDRLKDARQELRALLGGRESRRGNYVFGVYDGVTRWAPAAMAVSGCFSGADLERFAQATGGDKAFVRAQAGRIGIVPEEKICPWNPADHRHAVPTLLIKGSRDAVLAGCQAEDFFSNGLQNGRRVLLELRGLGHDVSVANLYEGSDPSAWTRGFAGLIEDFIRMPAKAPAFLKHPQVVAKLKKFKVSDRTGDSKVAQCGKNP